MLNRNSIRAAAAAVAIVFSATFQTSVYGIFANGDFITHSQDTWGSSPTPSNAAGLLRDNYTSVYASTFGRVEVGIPGTSGFSMVFSNSFSLLNYLPALGSSGPLATDYSNPTNTGSGAFGGEVIALRINIDFSDAGFTLGNSGIPFGDLELHGFPAQPLLNGLTVRQFLGNVNTLLGGGTWTYSVAQLAPITNELNRSFANGIVFQFAQDHLRVANIPGDYNANGIVDAADYVVWRDLLGQFNTGLAADGNADGQIDARDYDIWRANFGQTGGSTSAVTSFDNSMVPEPASLMAAVLGLTVVSGSLRRR